MTKTYTVKQVAEALGFSTNTVYKYLDEGKIKATRLGIEGRFRIPEGEVVRLLGLKGNKVQIAPALQAEDQSVSVSESQQINKSAEKLDFLRGISVPSLFDWFVATLSIFIGFSYFLFPSYVLEVEAVPFVEYIKWLKILLIFAGLGLLATDLFKPTRKVWHHIFHFALGIIFIVLAYFSFQTGYYLRMLADGGVAVVLLTTAFIKLADRTRFILFINILTIFAGLILILDPASSASAIFADWISKNKIPFVAVWYGLVGIVLWGSLALLRNGKLLALIASLIVAAGSFTSAFFQFEAGWWEDVVYATVLGSFVLILPFWHRFRNLAHSSKRELLVSFSWLVVIFAFGIGLVFYLQQSFKSYVLSENQKSLNVAKEIVQSYIEESQRLVESFAKEEKSITQMSSAKKDKDKLGQLVKKFYLSSTVLRRIILIDAEGKGLEVYPADETFQGIDLTGRNYFQQAKTQKKTTISEVIRPVIPGVPTAIVISAPILDETGLFLGVLGGSVDFVKLARKLNEVKFGSEGVFVIADNSKKIIYHPDEQMLLQPINNHNKALSLAVDGESGQIEGYNNRGRLALQAFAPITPLGWGIVAQQPLVDVLRHQSTVSFVVFLITVASGVGSLLAVLYLRRV